MGHDAQRLGRCNANFLERAAALAAEIDGERPDLIGLQEAMVVRTQSPPDGPATSATTVALDYVQLLLDARPARRLAYEIDVHSIRRTLSATNPQTGRHGVRAF